MVQPPRPPPIPIWLRRPNKPPIREQFVRSLGSISSWFDVETSIEHQVIVQNAIIEGLDPYSYPAWASELVIPVSKAVSKKAEEEMWRAGNEKSYAEHWFNALMEYPEEAAKMAAAAARAAAETVDSAGNWIESRVESAVNEVVDYYLFRSNSPIRMPLR